MTQPIGGSTHVDKGSSMEFWGDVSFLGNTLAYLTDAAWVRFEAYVLAVPFPEIAACMVGFAIYCSTV